MNLESTTELLRTLGDPTRVRLLSLLKEEELTVAELTSVLQIAQSRVSTHLAKLREAGLVRDRKDGPASYHSLSLHAASENVVRIWSVLNETVEDSLLAQDRDRVREIVRGRSGKTWADSVAGNMERHYSPGRTWEASLRAMAGLLRLGDVLDVASGDGALSELLAPHANSVTCLDVSETVVQAGRRRFSGRANVRFEVGDMHALPFESHSFDEVLLMGALSYTEEPERVVREAARVLRPGGRLVGVALDVHAHRDAAAAYGHRNGGFEPSQLEAILARAEACPKAPNIGRMRTG